MKNVLARIKGAQLRSKQRDTAMPPPQPEEPFLAIGDLHGRADLLLELDKMIEENFRGWPVVFLGDYVDRGEESRAVLEMLMPLSPKGSPSVTCLMGNHERMLLDFIENPLQSARRWIQNGGLQTLASFGLSIRLDRLKDEAAMRAIRNQLVDAMGTEMIDWLHTRPLSWQSGNIWAVHAGAKPSEPMEVQRSRYLLWGHPRFEHENRQDGKWIVHGHTIVEVPFARKGRIAVDTGAYATGVLTAAAITPGEVSFLQTGAG